MPCRTMTILNLTQDDATEIVSEWLRKHPSLIAELGGRDPQACRDALTPYLFPYTRFPETLDKLIGSALDSVDWGHIAREFWRGQ